MKRPSLKKISLWYADPILGIDLGIEKAGCWNDPEAIGYRIGTADFRDSFEDKSLDLG